MAGKHLKQYIPYIFYTWWPETEIIKFILIRISEACDQVEIVYNSLS